MFATLVGFVLLGIIVATISLIVSGFALSTLWGWFVVPILGFPKLTLAAAIGIVIMINLLIKKNDTKEEEEEEKEEEKKDKKGFKKYVEKKVDAMGQKCQCLLANSMIALSIGWIVHLFI